MGLLRDVYSVSNAQQFGSPGQAQNGVDVYGKSPRYGMIGIQCKRLKETDGKGVPYPGGPISRAFLRREALEALDFRPDLKMWILATTVRRDTKVQGWVDEINEEWEKEGRKRFALVWSWDECVSFLNSHPDLQRAYYQNVIQVRAPKDLDEIILKTIRMAFARPAFEVPFHCESPTAFLGALRDTQQALRTGELVDRESRVVIRKAIGGYHDLHNGDARRDLGQIDKMLRKLRNQIELGLKDKTILMVDDYLDFRDQALARFLEDLRDQCVRGINRVLAGAGIPPV